MIPGMSGPVTHLGCLLSIVVMLVLPKLVSGQIPKRCDLSVKSTPGQAGASPACLDLVALKYSQRPIITAGNATRISIDGMTICRSAFISSTPGGADIVFIYDNSGSMYPQYAKIDSITKDTSYFNMQGCVRVDSTMIVGPLTYMTFEGPRTVQLLNGATNCIGGAGDPYHARAQIIKREIDYLMTKSPNSIRPVLRL